ncbi:baeRF3 domain-containing protein [Streptomyces sp. SS162]|uniref:baeRF3 domain-containing protein n=1 Tax=Streptomyces sp. SS162 TaxID=3108484 RepID=UPI002F4296E8
MHPVLSTEVLAELRRPRPYPALSLTMPTHRRQPDNAQDPVRLRTLVARAEKALQDDPAITRERRADVLEQLERAVAEFDLAYAEDGLVLYAAPGEHQAWSLARTVPERVVVSDTFLTRNLVAAHAAEQPQWAMALAADHVSLWSAGPERAVEYTGGGFPLTRSLEVPDAEREQRVGDLASSYRDEDTCAFFRTVHGALRTVLDAAPRPLTVFGDAPALALLEETGPLPQGTLTVRHGGLARGPAEAVREAVGPVRGARDEALATTVSAELEAARGRHEYAGGLDEVWRAAGEGRIGLLAVEEHHRAVVRDRGDHLEPADPGASGARDDIVDEIVERALENGAEVRFVPDDTLADAGRIAAVLRF